ncbi:MAG TPA: alpha/beta hydrolase [Pseudonocardiaceae bacterium]|jgi:pimeloyl-ACP methyl ester carboxylesterase|nr:alpha/beta hydrolase [Pseudonocardiaceae bacterium]
MTTTESPRSAKATFVLIPGAGGVGAHFDRVEPLLRAAGHHTIATDLPAADPSAGIAEYADTVLAAVAEDRANRHADDRDDSALVVVGQSLGGFTAPVVAERLSAKLIVLVNAMTPTPGELPGDWWANTGQQQARLDKAAQDGRGPEFDLVADFFHDVPPEITAEVLAAGEQPQSDGPFGKPWPLTAWPDLPTRFIAGRDDRFFPLAFQRRVVAERLGIGIDELPGGHLIALSRPTELAGQLLAYLRELDLP